MTGPVPDPDPGGGAAVEVLLVDDDETWAESTAQLLERQRESFAVTTATDLTAASAAFAEADPDCVVCDYDLEAGTGLELLAEVRDRDPDRPFLLITGQGDESVASDAIRRQVTDYIPKRSLGGRDDRLARRVESAVDTYRARRALARERRSKEAMLDILTATSSREGLAREVCDHLVERGYACAWIATLNDDRGVVPLAAAGETGYPDAVVGPGTTPESGSEPALRALARRAPQVVAPIHGRADASREGESGTEAGSAAGAGDPGGGGTGDADGGGGTGDGDDGTGDPGGGPDDGDATGTGGWRSVAAEYGFGSAAAVPVAHEGTLYGVLAAYGDGPTLGPGERDLLVEYGETVGYAFRSADWKESLLSPTPVAVEFAIDDPGASLVAFARALPGGGRLDLLTTVPREGAVLYVARATGLSPGDLRAAAAGTVERIEVTGTDPLRCELLVAVPTPETVVADRGGRVVEAVVRDGRLSVTVVCPTENDVGALVDAVRSSYPGAEVGSVRSTDPARGAAGGDHFASLTDRQRRAVELAFYSGYFERPREHNTTEVAEKLGVSRQTFTQHLRAGQRKLLAGLLGADRGRD